MPPNGEGAGEVLVVVLPKGEGAGAVLGALLPNGDAPGALFPKGDGAGTIPPPREELARFDEDEKGLEAMLGEGLVKGVAPGSVLEKGEAAGAAADAPKGEGFVVGGLESRGEGTLYLAESLLNISRSFPLNFSSVLSTSTTFGGLCFW